MLDGPVPSPGTRRLKVMGTSDVLVRQQATVCGKPAGKDGRKLMGAMGRWSEFTVENNCPTHLFGADPINQRALIT